MGKGEEEVQTRESEQGEPVKNPPGEIEVTVSESQTAIIDMMSGGVTTSCATESKCPPCHDCKSGMLHELREQSNELRVIRSNLLTVMSGEVCGTPIRDSARASPSEIAREKSQD